MVLKRHSHSVHRLIGSPFQKLVPPFYWVPPVIRTDGTWGIGSKDNRVDHWFKQHPSPLGTSTIRKRNCLVRMSSLNTMLNGIKGISGKFRFVCLFFKLLFVLVFLFLFVFFTFDICAKKWITLHPLSKIWKGSWNPNFSSSFQVIPYSRAFWSMPLHT